MSVDLAIAEMLAALDEEMAAAMTEATRVVADDAAAQHPYQNRTGRLQSRTVPGLVRGLASRGRVTGEVLGDTRYGSFVNDGTERNRAYPFLEPAAARKETEVDALFGAALERAAQRAWGGA